MNEAMKQHARERHDLHKDHQSHRPLSPDYEDIGLAGEFAFSEFSGVPVDLAVRPGGDGGRDGRILFAYTFDVKCAKKPYNLLHEAGKKFADIFVLAGYNVETGEAKLLGWEWGGVLQRTPVRDFGYGVLNHFIPAEKLRSMDEMRARMDGR